LAGGEVYQLEADGPAVGMMPEMPFDTRTADVPPEARLLVFSDGVFEIEQKDGVMWPFADFLTHIKAGFDSPGLIEGHYAFVRGLGMSESLNDDFSMLEAVFHTPPPKADARKPRKKVGPTDPAT
jgi:sigma-B regulation protein RsbU (phosphoserine phosphatase)